MSRKLDIDKRIERWFPTFKRLAQQLPAVCPICGNDDLEVDAQKMEDNIGYVVITCKKCNKSGYFSRVDFSKYKGIISEEPNHTHN